MTARERSSPPVADLGKAFGALEREFAAGPQLEEPIVGESTRSRTPEWLKRQFPSFLRPEDGVDAAINMDLATRRTLLAGLGDAASMLRAAEERGRRDPLSRTLATTLRESLSGQPALPPHELDALDRTDLTSRAVVARWLRGLVSGLPAAEALEERIALVDLSAPLKKLVQRGFVGRAAQLRALEDYVDIVDAKDFLGIITRALHRAREVFRHSPPIVVSGPGGVGKSTLIAKFILEHLQAKTAKPFPFAYVDFDRPGVRSRDPAPALREVVRQLAIQYPAMRDAADERTVSLQKGAIGHDLNFAESSVRDLSFDIRNIVGMLQHYLPPGIPILLVLDTFEEVQYFGAEAVAGHLDAFGYLYQALPQMRLVLSGRSPLGDDLIETNDIVLEGFSRSEARAFLQSYVDQAGGEPGGTLESLVEELAIAATRGSIATPLTLVLAGDALLRAYAGRSSDSPEKLVRFVRRLKRQQMQEGLYGRILDHLHDEQLRKIAHPGLVLRRIDADVLIHVLAPALRLHFKDPAQAADLVDKLSEEGALVEPDPRGGVRHRSDVRKLMLADMTQAERGQSLRIERLAARYYRARANSSSAIEDAAERLYHLMRLDTDLQQLEKEWRPGLEPHLANALDEIPPRQRIWLATKLNVGVDVQTRGRADQAYWELDTERSVRQLLTYGTEESHARALQLLFERPRVAWKADGPLPLLAAEVLIASGDFLEARRILGDLQSGSPPEFQARWAMLLAQILQALDEPGEALGVLAHVEPLHCIISIETELRVLLIRIRLLADAPARMRDDEHEQDLQRARDAALILLQAQPPTFLKSAPALLRDAAAEFGADHPPLLKFAIRTLGLQLIDNDVIRLAIEAVEDWDEQLSAKFRDNSDSLSEGNVSILRELTGDPNVDDLLDWFRANRSRAGNAIVQLWNRYGMPVVVRRKFAALYADVSRRSIRRDVHFA